MATGSSTLSNFIPKVWSARLRSNLNKQFVFGNLANRDFEGEIAGAGDTVYFNGIGRVSLISYARNGSLTAAETLTQNQKTLTITEANAFNFKLDDIDKAQTKGSIMEEAMKESAYTLGLAADSYIASLYPNVTQGAAVAGALTTGTKVYDMLVANRQKFRELNVPIDDLSVVLAPWMETALLNDNRFHMATASGDSVIATAKIGTAAGFQIYISNNIFHDGTGTNDYHVMSFAGKKAISFADQINKVEAYRPQDSFSDAVKGLHVYGAAVMQPEFAIANTVTMA